MKQTEKEKFYKQSQLVKTHFIPGGVGDTGNSRLAKTVTVFRFPAIGQFSCPEIFDMTIIPSNIDILIQDRIGYIM